MSNLVIHHLGEPSHFVVYLLLLRIETQCVHLLHEALHLIVVHLLLQHELKIGPFDLRFKQALHVRKRGPRLDVRGYLLHRLLYIVEICFLVQLLVELVPHVGQVRFCWENLFDVSDALVLNLKRVVDAFESQFYYVLDVGPLGVCLN